MATTDLRFDVAALDRASQVFTRLGRTVENFEKRLQRLDQERVTVDVEARTEKAERQIGAFATDLRRKLTAAARALPEIEVTADSTPAQRELARIRQEMTALGDAEIGVDIDAAEAQRRLEQLDAELKRLGAESADIQVQADVAAAIAALKVVDTEVGKVDGKTAKVKVDVDRSLSDSIVKVAALGRALATLAVPAAAVAAAPTIAAIGGAALTASGAVGLLPGGLLAAAAATAGLKVGLSGVGDALSELEDAEKFAEALKELSPAAREFAISVRDIGPAWDSVRLDTQERLFAGLGAEMQRLSSAYLPSVRSGLTGVSGEFNLLAKDLVGFATEARTVENVDTIFKNVQSTLQAARPAAQNFVAALLDIGVVGSEQLPELASGLTDATGRFRSFIDEARRSGELEQWIQGGIGALEQLGSIAGNTGSTLLNVFEAQEQAGTSLLAKLDQLTAAMDRWTASAEGQQTLANLFRTIDETVDAALPGVQALGQAVVDVINRLSDAGVLQAAAGAFSALATNAAPVVTTLGNLAAAVLPPLLSLLQQLAPVLVPVAAGLLGLMVAARVGSAIQGLTTKVADFNTKLRGVEGGAGKFKTIIGGLATAIGAGGPLGLAITAAVTGVGLLAGAWADSQAEADAMKGRIDALADSLNSFTGAATEATLAQRAQELGSSKLGDGTTSYATALGRAGVSTRDFVAATTGNEQALQKVRTQLDASTAAAIKASPAYANNVEQIGRMGISLADLAAAAQGNVPAQERLNDAIARSAPGSLEATEANRQLVDQLLKSGGASAEMGQNLNRMAGEFAAASAQAREAGAASLVFSDGLDAVKAGLAGLAAGGKPTAELTKLFGQLGESADVTAKSAGDAAAALTGVEGGASAARDSMQQSRDAFIQAATSAGIAAPAAEELANQVGLIPSAAAIIFQTNATGVQAEMITLNERIKQLPPNTSITVTDLSAEARANLERLGFVITEIPGTKQVTVTAPTAQAQAQLDAFVAAGNGAVITMTGDMNTDPANGKITQTVQLGNGQTATMTYDANASAADGKIHATVDLGNGQTATLVYDANPDPATGKIQGVVTLADGTTANVTLNPNDQVSPTLDQLKNPTTAPVNLVPNSSQVPPAKTEAAAPTPAPVVLTPDSSQVPPAKTTAAAPTPAPVPLVPDSSQVPPAKTSAAAPTDAPVNLVPNTAAVDGAKTTAAAPTSSTHTINVNDSAVTTAKSNATGATSSTHTITVNDSAVATAKSNAAGATSSTHTINVTDNVPAAKTAASQPSSSLHTINADDRAVVDAKNRAVQPSSSLHTINVNDRAVRDAKAAAQRPTSSTHTIHVRTVGGGVPRAAGAYTTPRATGAYVQPAYMAAGGMRRMSAARAEIVPPNQPRVIGDRQRHDEAFIPINGSARSHSFLNTTANRMGYGLVPLKAMATGGMLGDRPAVAGLDAGRLRTALYDVRQPSSPATVLKLDTVVAAVQQLTATVRAVSAPSGEVTDPIVAALARVERALAARSPDTAATAQARRVNAELGGLR